MPTRRVALLTERDKKLLTAVVACGTTEDIARRLRLTNGTVRVYLHYLYRKIRVKNMTQAAVWWAEYQK